MIYSREEILGDGLMKLPAIAGARRAFPDARLIWCVANRTVYAGALKPLAAQYLDEIIEGPAQGGQSALDGLSLRPFGGRRFDVVIDTQRLFGPALAARRAARTLFVSEAARFALSARRPPGPLPDNLTDRVAALISLAAGFPVAPEPISILDPELLAAAAHLLPPGPRYVGLAPGAGGKDKIWPLDRFLALAAHVRASGAVPVLFVGPAEMGFLPAIHADAPYALLPELDRTDSFQHLKGPLLAAALAGRLSAAVANDSGIGHALAVGGAPLLSLQRDARKARKFRPAARRLEMLVAQDFGGGDMAAIPLGAAVERLEALLLGRA